MFSRLPRSNLALSFLLMSWLTLLYFTLISDRRFLLAHSSTKLAFLSRSDLLPVDGLNTFSFCYPSSSQNQLNSSIHPILRK